MAASAIPGPSSVADGTASGSGRSRKLAGLAVVAASVAIVASPFLPWYSTPSGAPVSRPPSATGFELCCDGLVLDVTENSNALIVGLNQDGWYTSFLGPLVPVLIGLGLAAFGVRSALGRGGSLRESTGSLVLALVSLIGALTTGASGGYRIGGLGGAGLSMWTAASVVAVVATGVLFIAAPRQEDADFGSRDGLAAVALADFISVVVSSVALYSFEEQHPFAAGPVFIAYVIQVGAVAVWPVVAIEVMLRRPRRVRRLVPAGLGLILFAALLSLLVIAAATNS